MGGMQAAIGDGNLQIQGSGNSVAIFNLPSHEFPNHQTDWTKLLEQTRENLTAIQDKIGNIVFLPRPAELEAIQTAFEISKVAVLLGPSGCGKSVIAKSWAEKQLNSSQVIWWKASSFDVPDFAFFQSRLGLSYPLRDVLAVAAPRAYVLKDSGVSFTIRVIQYCPIYCHHAQSS